MEAALILPFFLSILLTFFSFFQWYALGADLYLQAAAEAKKAGIALGCVRTELPGDLTICKSAGIEQIWGVPFFIDDSVTQKAVCRPWIGFTGLESGEAYVYITPNGSVYHLYRDCTHLNLSVQTVSLAQALRRKNDYGERYGACEICYHPGSGFVYITPEGNRYHRERSCSGLKRTVLQVPLSEVGERRCCIRCMSGKE